LSFEANSIDKEKSCKFFLEIHDMWMYEHFKKKT